MKTCLFWSNFIAFPLQLHAVSILKTTEIDMLNNYVEEQPVISEVQLEQIKSFFGRKVWTIGVTAWYTSVLVDEHRLRHIAWEPETHCVSFYAAGVSTSFSAKATAAWRLPSHVAVTV